jgi:alkylhydroperoxidase/carboxymuconolactone decarboxylase family protein YurZ
MDTKIAKHYETIKKFHPDYIDAVENLGGTTTKAGPLNEKTCHLIQLAASITSKLEGATQSHTKDALDAGASHDEIRHSVLLLTNTIGFPNVMAGMQWVNEILED